MKKKSWNTELIFWPTNRLQPVACACKSLQSCPTVCDPMDYRPPSSSMHGILQARILECVAMRSSRGSSHTGNWPPPLTSPALQGDSLLLSRRGSPETLVQYKCVWWHPDISVSSLFSSEKVLLRLLEEASGSQLPWPSLTSFDWKSPQPLWAINTCTCLLLSDVH